MTKRAELSRRYAAVRRGLPMLMAAAMLGLASAADAQTAPAGPGAPAQPPSPEIMPDNRVTFRLMAPNATTVQLRANFPSWMQPSLLPMTKGADGMWSVTAGPLEPELRVYTFIVDGVAMPDPRNPNYRREGASLSSLLLVPGAQSDLYAVKNVPHGTVSQIWYPSPTLNKPARRAVVYTPPGYEQGAKRYPVLYLLHGGALDEESWTGEGRAAQILDNLIAAGRAQPMIVVMPNSNVPQSASRNAVDRSEGPPGGVNLEFADSLVKDVIPFIDRTFRTRTDRYSRAIAGLSMGGGQTWYAAFRNLRLFGWVDIMSGAPHNIPGTGLTVAPPPKEADIRAPGLTQDIDPEKVFAALPDLNAADVAKLRLFELTVGAHDGFITEQRTMARAMRAKGIKVQTVEKPGYMHEWPFWRLALSELAVRLFQPTK